MPDTAAPPAVPAPAATSDEPRGWDAMDTIGILAGIILLVIIADIFTDGRVISRRLRKPPAEPEPVPGE